MEHIVMPSPSTSYSLLIELLEASGISQEILLEIADTTAEDRLSSNIIDSKAKQTVAEVIGANPSGNDGIIERVKSYVKQAYPDIPEGNLSASLSADCFIKNFLSLNSPQTTAESGCKAFLPNNYANPSEDIKALTNQVSGAEGSEKAVLERRLIALRVNSLILERLKKLVPVSEKKYRAVAAELSKRYTASGERQYIQDTILAPMKMIVGKPLYNSNGRNRRAAMNGQVCSWLAGIYNAVETYRGSSKVTGVEKDQQESIISYFNSLPKEIQEKVKQVDAISLSELKTIMTRSPQGIVHKLSGRDDPESELLATDGVLRDESGTVKTKNIQLVKSLMKILIEDFQFKQEYFKDLFPNIYKNVFKMISDNYYQNISLADDPPSFRVQAVANRLVSDASKDKDAYRVLLSLRNHLLLSNPLSDDVMSELSSKGLLVNGEVSPLGRVVSKRINDIENGNQPGKKTVAKTKFIVSAAIKMMAGESAFMKMKASSTT